MRVRIPIAGAVVLLLAASCSSSSSTSTADGGSSADGPVADATSDSPGENVEASTEAEAPTDAAPDVWDASRDATQPPSDASTDVSTADGEAGSVDATPDAPNDSAESDASEEEAAAPTCPPAPLNNQTCSTPLYCTYDPDSSVGAQCCSCYQGRWLCVRNGDMGGGGGSGICPPTEPSGGICPYSDGPICYYCDTMHILEAQCSFGSWTTQFL